MSRVGKCARSAAIPILCLLAARDVLGQATICTIGQGPYASCNLPAHVGGRWSQVYTGKPLNPNGFPEATTDVGHAVLLKNGLILAVDGGDNRVFLIEINTQINSDGEPIVHGPYPVPRHFVPPDPNPQLRHTLFCSGHCQLADGNILFVGGGHADNPYASAHQQCSVFELDPPDWAAGLNSYTVSLNSGATFRFRWKEVDDSPAERYYPTLTLRADGSVLATGGRATNSYGDTLANIPMIFEPTSPLGLQWVSLNGARVCDCDFGFCDLWGSSEFLEYNPETGEYGCIDAAPPMEPNERYDFHINFFPSVFQTNRQGMMLYANGGHASPFNVQPWLLNVGLQTWTRIGQAETDDYDSEACLDCDTSCLAHACPLICSEKQIIRGEVNVLLRPDQVFRVGGRRGHDCHSAFPQNTVRAYRMNVLSEAPLWERVEDVHFGREDCFGVIDPLGRLNLCGGDDINNNSDAGIVAHGAAILNPEWFDPEPESDFGLPGAWKVLCPHAQPRWHHTVWLLLPDGRIIAISAKDYFGEFTHELWDDPATPDPDHYMQSIVAPDQAPRTMEILSPPYMFDADGNLACRPAIFRVYDISTLPPVGDDILKYGHTLNVDTNAVGNPSAGFNGKIVGVNLIRPGAVTHSFDQDQRFVPLQFVAHEGSSKVTISAPTTAYEAPPGYYMLFVIGEEDGRQVPSVARIVKVEK